MVCGVRRGSTKGRRDHREDDSNHPGELDGGGVLLFSENSLDQFGMTAIAICGLYFNQPTRVFVLEVD
jgi:hypothetical protein